MEIQDSKLTVGSPAKLPIYALTILRHQGQLWVVNQTQSLHQQKTRDHQPRQRLHQQKTRDHQPRQRLHQKPRGCPHQRLLQPLIGKPCQENNHIRVTYRKDPWSQAKCLTMLIGQASSTSQSRPDQPDPPGTRILNTWTPSGESRGRLQSSSSTPWKNT